MRRLRRAALLGSLCLLMSVETFENESPWVMWRLGKAKATWEWERVKGWDTPQACKSALPRYIIPDDGTLLVNAIVNGWVCWPGDFDPRRPRSRSRG